MDKLWERYALSRELSESITGEPNDPYELATSTPFPYEHGKLSKIFKNYTQEKQRKISKETDEQFKRVTGFKGKLDSSNKEHEKLIWKWLRIRDVIMQLNYGAKGDVRKAYKIEGKKFNVDPLLVKNEWTNIVKITTSVEVEIVSGTIINTILPYEAARNIPKDKAMYDFSIKVKEEFSSPVFEPFDLMIVYNSDYGTKKENSHGYRLRFKHFWFIASGSVRNQANYQPMLDLTKQSKLNFLWPLKSGREYNFPEWSISETNGSIRAQMSIEPTSA